MIPGKEMERRRRGILERNWTASKYFNEGVPSRGDVGVGGKGEGGIGAHNS